MILGPDGKPVDVDPAGEGGADPYEKRLGSLFMAQRAEVDSLYASLRESMTIDLGPPRKLTRRDWVRTWWSRLRRSVARPLVRLADWISPGVSGEGCDC